MSVHDAAWHTGLFFYVLVRPLLIGTGGLSKWRERDCAIWPLSKGRRRAPRQTCRRAVTRPETAELYVNRRWGIGQKKKVCVDLWTVSVLLWLHGPSVTCFDAAVKAVTEHFRPELSSVMMLNFKKKRSQWCDHTSVPNEARFVSLIYQHYFKEALWASCFDFQIQKSYFVLVSSPFYIAVRLHVILPNLYIVNISLGLGS